MDPNEQIIKEQIENAPQGVKDFLVDDSWRKDVADIAQKNGLSSEKATALENEVLFVLLAMELKTDLPKNIADSVGLSKDSVILVTNELNTRVFEGIEQWLPTEDEDNFTPDKTPVLDQAELKGATDVLNTHNLPAENFSKNLSGQETQTTFEEKINPFVGTPGEKNNWEQRKQQVADKIVSSSNYGKADPYREPIK
jgi:hypothetical protein